MQLIPRLTLHEVAVGVPARLADVELDYTVHGRLNRDGDNCIVLPTYYTGDHESYVPWIGPGRPFDPARWCIVVPNLLGNGTSGVRDLDTGRPWDPLEDPTVSIADNVMVQRSLLDHLGVKRVALVAGWSMGGLQAYSWAVAQPDFIGGFLSVCGASRCWPLNAMFLQGVAPYLEHALTHPEHRPASLAGFGRAYAGWAYSAAYFRDELWRGDGFLSRDALLEAWAEDHQASDPAHLLATLRTWQAAELAEPGRTLQAQLAAVNIPAILMPSSTDMYFTLAENAIEAAWLPQAELRPIIADHGHVAGRPGHLPAVTAQVSAAVTDLLERGHAPTPWQHR